ncbi:MAG TPA: hypothetical protein DDW84_09610 [Phycisphaerales bacterium]|nr:MAG: hypothetical protein A2Y13_10295 [Planctomycetes bacterium GWC2_45_44]HBG79074.1 hypothetical protein [Phycisphaerales bacterium]
MAKLVGRLRRPESNRKKYIIIAAVIAAVCLVAGGGIAIFSRDKAGEDEFGRGRFRMPPDANLPNTDKQSAQEIIDYRNSAAFKNLTAQQRMRYMMQSGRKVMDYQMDTYFTLPATDRTAYLDKMIDEMQTMRKDMEQMRMQMPDRRRPDANDPNRQARQQARAARMADPSNARSGAERGTALQRAQRQQFRAAMEARMKERGISMPRGPGGGR